MPKSPGPIQAAIVADLIRNPNRDAHTLARIVYNVFAPEKPTKSQLEVIRRAINGLVRRKVVTKSPYPSAYGYPSWILCGPTGREQSERIRRQKQRLQAV
jgi:hypothetical protein